MNRDGTGAPSIRQSKAKKVRQKVDDGLYYFLIKNFNYSISARDTGNDLVRQRANSIAQSPDNFFQRSKYFVMESTLSNFFPNLFNGVHFRHIWWDIETDNIIRQI